MKRSQGFTLIETMIVMTIVVVLAALAYPGYQDFIIKARRAEAQAVLLELMQKQERYFTQHNRYLAFSADAGNPEQGYFKWWSGGSAKSSAYELRGHACEGQPITRCIIIEAIPGTDRVDSTFRDGDCKTLTLSSMGEHTASGSAAGCWP
ncbi:prepilin-type N-terminal cleavage/methylation domain-containing protein [Massilia sp. CCM 8695]|uniref:Prepilin-type N-terminal cleavage/methylation domain-containing protein n=1 Tax=Massilia frigida TaxID=2609281 RepID=A0ABX0NHM8_9BURK|nr:type IV pilin protein [Massilia frigida]NHZ82804.1 prepilin-type N-terminal cleavage/methylation domain-containing protein [Massilia frigida]